MLIRALTAHRVHQPHGNDRHRGRGELIPGSDDWKFTTTTSFVQTVSTRQTGSRATIKTDTGYVSTRDRHSCHCRDVSSNLNLLDRAFKALLRWPVRLKSTIICRRCRSGIPAQVLLHGPDSDSGRERSDCTAQIAESLISIFTRSPRGWANARSW